MNFTKTIKRTKLYIISFLIMMCFSCKHEIKFNKTDWSKRSDGFYLNRDKMINDLILNHELVGLNKIEVFQLLGEPENYSDAEPNSIYYNIVTDYGFNIDPVYIKNLRIGFNKLDQVESFKIEETK
jgi:hypothetical protein